MKLPYTIVFRQYQSRWLALCLENGVVSEGGTHQQALDKLHDAIESLDLAMAEDSMIYSSAIPVKELHEFLSFGIENAIEAVAGIQATTRRQAEYGIRQNNVEQGAPHT